jgi:hypothetical protein
MGIRDLTGQRFGRLNVIKLEPFRSKSGRAIWKCLCDCGNIVDVNSTNLRSGNTKSCGCLKDEVLKSKNNKNITHGIYHKNARLYRIWNSMMSRCYNKNNSRYKDYGLIGIVVFELWHNVVIFYDWAINNGYTDELTIDRVDNNKGYSPSNCRWITNKEQQNNRRNNKILTLNGVSHTQREWEEIQGLTRGVICNRLRMGWSIDRAITGGITKSC